ncbi:MAG: cation transporter [Dehalococcoidales bacterium]|nr:cation transporter [Dehalococcoidales bacterium]
METVTLHSENISCNHCVMTIKRAVGKLPGVSEVGGDPQSKNVQVTYDPSQVGVDKIKETMAEEGYPAS